MDDGPASNIDKRIVNVCLLEKEGSCSLHIISPELP